jgi:hypothetical protein
MRPFRLATLVLAPLALLQLACAGGSNLTPIHDTMPAARAAMRPEHRLFYDAMKDDGDWTLIEPYGYVFRPSVNFVAWRPYTDGYWAPSDVYGWVWISAEPFGWATYHYGEWLYDRYQGWVWVPGVDWGPAWVAWQQAGDYVGWSPLLAPGSATTAIPGGAYTYAAIGDLGATDLRTRTHPASELGNRLADARPIENFEQQGTVLINRGPSIAAIERRTGPLQRVRIADVLPAGAVPPAMQPGTPATPIAPGAASAEAIRQAAVESAQQVKTLTQQSGTPPAVIKLVRPDLRAPTGRAPAGRGALKRAVADSTRRK